MPIDIDKSLAAVSVIRDLILSKSIESTSDASLHYNGHSDQTEPLVKSLSVPPSPFSSRTVTPASPVSSMVDDEQAANETLQQAVQLYRSGQRDAAIIAMNRLVQQYPNTKSAKMAQTNLRKLGY